MGVVVFISSVIEMVCPPGTGRSGASWVFSGGSGVSFTLFSPNFDQPQILLSAL
jgi:hypothetical protein